MGGFRINGIAPTGINGNRAGWSIATGDFNGDGIQDLLIGAPFTANDMGAAYVIFGRNTGFPNPLSLSSLNGTNGFTINGTGGNFGYAVAAGDINGDGKTDIAVGAPWKGGGGSTYVIFGHNGAWGATYDITALTGSDGFRIDGPAGALSGEGLAVGDINADGKAELVIGMPGMNTMEGAVAVVFGKAAGWGATADIFTIAQGNTGYYFTGTGGNNANVGISAAVGDVTGDGIGDLVIGSYGKYLGSFDGTVFIVNGKAGIPWTGVANLTSIDGNNGSTWGGPPSAAPPKSIGGYLGIGDFNGNGVADLVMSAPGIPKVYLWPGQSGGNLAIVGNISGSGGFEMSGNYTSAGAGIAMGDFNGDGKSDMLLGARSAATGGKAEIVFGKTSWSSSWIPALNGTDSFTIQTTDATQALGYAVAAGDVNGDGKADMIIGAPGANSLSGSVYVLYGKQQATWPALIDVSWF